MFFQMLMSVLWEHPTAVPMVCASIPMDRTTTHVNLDTLKTDGCAEVEINI